MYSLLIYFRTGHLGTLRNKRKYFKHENMSKSNPFMNKGCEKKSKNIKILKKRTADLKASGQNIYQCLCKLGGFGSPSQWEVGPGQDVKMQHSRNKGIPPLEVVS